MISHPIGCDHSHVYETTLINTTVKEVEKLKIKHDKVDPLLISFCVPSTFVSVQFLSFLFCFFKFIYF